MNKYILLIVCSIYSKAILAAELDTYLGHAINEKDKVRAVQLVALMTTLKTPPTPGRIKLIVTKLFDGKQADYDTALAAVKLGGAAPAMPVSPKFQDIRDAAGATKAMADLFENKDGSGAMAVQAITAAAGKTGADKRSQAIAAAIRSNLQS